MVFIPQLVLVIHREMPKERKKYKINPSLEVIGHFIYEGEKVIRTKGVREGLVNGKPERIVNKDLVKSLNDRSKFVKFFLDSDSIQEFIELTITAQRVLAYILKEKIEYNKNYILLTVNNVAEATGMNRKTVSTGLGELLDKEWLYRSPEPYKLWINLSFICLGQREEIWHEFQKTVLK